MDSQSKRILIAAIAEKRELVQMLYEVDRQGDGLKEYTELKRLGGLLRKAINGDPRPDNQGTGNNTQPG